MSLPNIRSTLTKLGRKSQPQHTPELGKSKSEDATEATLQQPGVKKPTEASTSRLAPRMRRIFSRLPTTMPSISTPIYPVHVSHGYVDKDTATLGGLPREWEAILGTNSIIKQDLAMPRQGLMPPSLSLPVSPKSLGSNDTFENPRPAPPIPSSQRRIPQRRLSENVLFGKSIGAKKTEEHSPKQADEDRSTNRESTMEAQKLEKSYGCPAPDDEVWAGDSYEKSSYLTKERWESTQNSGKGSSSQTSDAWASTADPCDSKSVYSDASMPISRKKGYVSGFAQGLLEEILPSLPEGNSVNDLSGMLPELLTAFALKFGLKAQSQMHLDIAFFHSQIQEGHCQDFYGRMGRGRGASSRFSVF